MRIRIRNAGYDIRKERNDLLHWYRVTIGEFVATGCGQSKKKAKHCAAKAILDKLLGAQNAGLTAPGQPTIPDLAQASNHPLKDSFLHKPIENASAPVTSCLCADGNFELLILLKVNLELFPCFS
jgi:hypothetical protein